MEAPAAGKVLEFLLTLLTLGLPGLPPGERDAHLWHAIPADAIVAFEWSSQGGGAAGKDGLEGLASDPELRALLEAVRKPAAADVPTKPPTTIYDIPGDQVVQVALSRPGCLYVALAPKESGLPPLQRLRAAVVLNVGNDAAGVIKQLSPLLPEWMLRDTRANPSLLALVTGLVQFRQSTPYLVWGVNQGAADETLVRLTNRNGGMAATPEFAQQFAAAAVERPGSVLWLRTSAALEAALDLIPNAAAVKARLSIAGSGSCVLVSGLEQGRVVVRGNVPRHSEPGTMLQREAFQDIPADAHLVLAGPLDLNEDLLRSISGLTADGRQSLQELRGALVAETPVDFGHDLFDAFGPNWLVYSAPSTGGPFGIGPVIAVDLRQPQLVADYFPAVMGAWQRHLAEQQNGHVLRRDSVKGVAVYSLQTPQQAAQGIIPSWCVTDRYLLLSFQPQPLRAHLRFLAGRQPRFAERLGKDVAFPERSVAFGFVDSPAVAHVVWPALPYLAGRIDPGWSIAAIPSAGAVLPYLHPTMVSVQAKGDSWQLECRNPLSLAVPALAGALLLEALQTSPAASASSSPSTGVSLGAPEGATTTEDKGVKPAVAVEVQPQAPPSAARQLLPGLIRAITPDDVESLIPADVFRRLEQGPTPEELQQREERRKQRELKRLQRKGLAP